MSRYVERRPVATRRRAENGYCYVQLFRDVLGERTNLKETKRIFGRFPKLKNVLMQLVRLSVTDQYVHAVYPTGLNMYHVDGDEIVLLSTLVIRHMFSEALIGGYDAAEDAAMQQSDYARRIAALASLGTKSVQEILENAATVVCKKELAKPDSMLQQFVMDTASDRLRNRKINLPYRLQPLELTMMQGQYPEFMLINSNGKSHPHAVAGNLRVLSMEVLLDKIEYRKNAAPVYGEDVYVVDIGGDYLCHAKMNRMNIHSDAPVITMRDSAREMTRHLAMAAMVKKGKMTRQTYDNLTGRTAPCKQRCTDKAQVCTVTAAYAILLHSEYDISRRLYNSAIAKIFNYSNFY